jgi:ABC-type amino acid transport substrate-binding protein
MKKLLLKSLSLFILSFCTTLTLKAQQANYTYANAWSTKSGVLNVQYHNNYPYSYADTDGEAAGIEIDIIKQFAKWLLDKKGINVEVKYERHDDFAKFYDKVKTNKTVSIGAGSVTVSSDRAREVKFSSPYLKNKPVLVSSVMKPTLSDVRNISKEFAGMTAVIVKGSIHEKLIKNIKENFWPQLNVEFVESPNVVLDKIAANEKYFGFLDLVTYWAAMQKDQKPLKLHRMNNTDSENFAFIFPKSSDWSNAFNEFFDSGIGFTGTDAYLDLLRRHLSSEIINAVAIQY